MKDVDVVREYYDNGAEAEWERLNGFHFEFEVTKVMLQKYLRKGSVLDIGGASGRYSIFLAKLGYDVTLVDISENNVKLAKQKAAEAGVKINAYTCDARDMSSLNLGMFDNVLLMGPLYHLAEKADRDACIIEAKKHLKKNGVLFAAFVATHGGFNYFLDACPDDIITNEAHKGLFDCMADNKSWRGVSWTNVFFIEQEEIEPFFDKHGFEKITVFGQEGVAATRLKDIEASCDEVKQFYLKLSLRLCEMPKYFAYSSHLVYVGKIKQ